MTETTLNQLINAENLFEDSASNLAILTAVLAPNDFSVIPADILTQFVNPDPIPALSAYFSLPEFALLERDVTEAAMHEFDDCVRRGLDPTTTSKRGVIDRLLAGAVAMLDTMIRGLAQLRDVLMNYSRSIQEPGF